MSMSCTERDSDRGQGPGRVLHHASQQNARQTSAQLLGHDAQAQGSTTDVADTDNSTLVLTVVWSMDGVIELTVLSLLRLGGSLTLQSGPSDLIAQVPRLHVL